MRPVRLAAAAVAALALSIPSFAQAGTVTRTPGVITYQASAITGVAESVNFGLENAMIFVTEEHGVTSADCNQTEPARVDCAPAPAIVVNLLGFNDSVVTDLLSGPYTMEAHGGGGGDSLQGTANADKLFGDDGDDRLIGLGGNDTLDGGGGSDALLDGPGDDSVSGGAGDDNLESDAGRDTFAGGDGIDRADYSQRSAPVTITLDGQADDGEAGEGDNIAADVESARGGSGADNIALGANGGDAGGGGGNDTIKGSPGEDRLEGDEGDDTIDARDGRFDSIDCGGGNDTVLADPGDGVANCEIAPDRDGDGFANEQDCSPDDAAIHPGAGEVFGNAIDEDCVGGPGYLRVDAGLIFKFKPLKKPARITWAKLKATALDEGDRVEIRCKGGKRKGCPFTLVKRNAVAAGTQSIDLVKLFKKRPLRQGATVEIRVLRDQQIGIVRVLEVTKGPKVKETRRCLLVGATAPSSCPAT